MFSTIISTPAVPAAAGVEPVRRLTAKCSLLPEATSSLPAGKMFGVVVPIQLNSSSRTSNTTVRRVAGVDPVMVADTSASLQAAAGISLPFDLPTIDSNWPVWMLGAVATFAIPLATGKLGPLGKLFDKFDAAVDTAQAVADMVDDVAEKVEEVADDIGNSLPAGALKDALEYVETMADEIEKAAEYSESLLNKVEEVGDQVEEFVESAISKKPVTATTVSQQLPQEVQAEI
ncbi:hypothetical protein LINGRAHAP2_LOCUS33432 [Linum grandiflorum]